MTIRRSLLGVSAVLAVFLFQGCALMGGSSGKRATNVEVRLLSQSCFNAEVVPCG